MKERLTRFLQTDIAAAFRDTLRFPAQSEERNTALDGLRGFAALMVIVEHSVAFGAYGIGRVGVYIFFILSAFLLSSQFLEKRGKAFQLSALINYFTKRILRIYPLFAIVVLVIGLLRFWYSADILRHLLLIRGDGIFWTIQQEVLFYVFLPVIMFVVYRLTKYRFWLTNIILLLLIAFAHIFVTKEVFGFQWLVPGTEGVISVRKWHLDIFIVGILVAVWASARPRITKLFTSSRLISILADGVAAVMIIALLALNKNTLYVLFNGASAPLDFFGLSYPYGDTGSLLVSLFTMVLMLLLIYNRRSLIFRLFASFPLRFVGTISFSVYLTHDFIIEYFKATNLVPLGAPLFLVATVFSIAVSIPIYAFIERPFMNLAKSLLK